MKITARNILRYSRILALLKPDDDLPRHPAPIRQADFTTFLSTLPPRFPRAGTEDSPSDPDQNERKGEIRAGPTPVLIKGCDGESISFLKTERGGINEWTFALDCEGVLTL